MYCFADDCEIVQQNKTFAGAPIDSYWKYAKKVPKTKVASCIHAPSYSNTGDITLEQDFYFEGLKKGVSKFSSRRLSEDNNLHCGFNYVGDEL